MSVIAVTRTTLVYKWCCSLFKQLGETTVDCLWYSITWRPKFHKSMPPFHQLQRVLDERLTTEVKTQQPERQMFVHKTQELLAVYCLLHLQFKDRKISLMLLLILFRFFAETNQSSSRYSCFFNNTLFGFLWMTSVHICSLATCSLVLPWFPVSCGHLWFLNLTRRIPWGFGSTSVIFPWFSGCKM